MKSDIRLRDEDDSVQKQIPITDRLTSIQKNIEKVEEVLGQINELQIKGKSLATQNNDKNTSDNDTAETTNAEATNLLINTESHSKLDVEELVEIDRGLQYVQWMQLIEGISNKVRYIRIRVRFAELNLWDCP